MRRYFCDVCGREFKPSDRTHLATQSTNASGYYGAMLTGLDVCAGCMRKGQDIDFHKAALEVWRNVVEADR